MNSQATTPTSLLVANEFLRLAAGEGKALTPLQLMKLVYIAHGWMLALYQKPLVSDDIEAWRYGPVIPDLYHAMKQYGAGSVTRPLILPQVSSDRELDYLEQDLIKQVYRLYGHLNGIQLSGLTHQAGTPWDLTWTNGERNSAISNDLITEHYRRLASERRSAA